CSLSRLRSSRPFPTEIDFPIPSNDDASKSIALIVKIMADAVREGLEERKRDKEQEAEKEAIEKQKAIENAPEGQEKKEEEKQKAIDNAPEGQEKNEEVKKG